MKRYLTTVIAALTLGLAFCSSASAAPVLDFTGAKHDPEVIHRGDEIVGYLVKVKNTGTTATSGTTTLAVSLPVGLEMAFGKGSGWSCNVKAEICTSATAVAPGGEFPQVRVQAWIDPQLAPDQLAATFLAFGNGVPFDASITETFTLAPAKPFGFEAFTAKGEDDLGDDYTAAGGHPFSATTSFAFPIHTTTLDQEVAPPIGATFPVENFRDIYVEPPPGFLANPEAIPAICSVQQVKEAKCPAAAAAGGIFITWAAGDVKEKVKMYRVVPEEGFAAAFAFRPISVSALTVVLRAKLRSNGDYRAVAVAPLAPQAPVLSGVDFATLCSYGVNGFANSFSGCKAPTEPDANPIPFLINPTRCSGPAPTTLAQVDSYQNVGRQDAEGYPDLSDPNWKGASATAPQNEGCEALTEAWVGAREPDFSFDPDTNRAAAPAAYSAHLHIPQDGLLEPDGTATAHLKDTTVRLPQGLVLNPSAAGGLGACSSEQAGYRGNHFPDPNPIRFSTVSSGCPDASKLGTVEVSTPLLDHTLPGAIYLAAQKDNPFGSDFAVYLVIDDEETGVKATIAGEVMPDPITGRIVATFENNPQAPVEDLDVTFFGGPRASLTNPDVCGSYTTRTEMTPWSAVDTDNPLPSETAVSEDTVAVDTPPAGASSCPASREGRPFAPSFTAKSSAPDAGGHSPFSLRMTRADGEQEFSEVTVKTPPGFAATLKGVAQCSQAGIARATARTASGQGAVEIADPSCPASSQIGTTTIGAGSGPNPTYVKTGKVYLSGPYKGAPLSLAFVVPAVAGPFDLGVQVVRTALNVDPRTAQITAQADPIPQILRGVPVQIRDIRVEIDRPDFTLNPTSCDALAVSGKLNGGSGAVANVSSHFQVGGCERLGFKPKLSFQLKGGTKRATNPKLIAILKTRPGDANIAGTRVTLPRSAFLDQAHIRTICTRVQWAQDTCPKGSIYGKATATTPLLDDPISGNVYLRSSDNKLPDLVADLRGPANMPIRIELVGRTDSVKGALRNTFDIVPDAPASSFRLELFGGKRGLVVNSRNLCGGTNRATVEMSAHNGQTSRARPVVGNDCAKKRKSGKANKKRR